MKGHPSIDPFSSHYAEHSKETASRVKKKECAVEPRLEQTPVLKELRSLSRSLLPLTFDPSLQGIALSDCGDDVR